MLLIYGGTRHRGVPCGISGNVFNIPEGQETFQAMTISLLVGVVVRVFTLWLRDRAIWWPVRTCLHIAGLMIVPYSYFVLRELEQVSGLSFCME